MVFWNLEAVALLFPEGATKCLFSLYSMKQSVQKPLFSGVPKYVQPAFLHLLVPVLSAGVRAAGGRQPEEGSFPALRQECGETLWMSCEGSDLERW